MPVVSSTFAVGNVQPCTRRNVIETHTTDTGFKFTPQYMALPGTDYAAVAAAHAVEIDEELRRREFEALEALPLPVLRDNTKAQFLVRIRDAYLNATGARTLILAKWIIDMLDSGFYTQLVLRTAFGLTVAQWTMFEVKLRALRDAAISLAEAKGE